MNFQIKMRQFASVVIIFRCLKKSHMKKQNKKHTHTGKTVLCHKERKFLFFNMLLLCIINT